MFLENASFKDFRMMKQPQMRRIILRDCQADQHAFAEGAILFVAYYYYRDEIIPSDHDVLLEPE